MRTVFPSFKVFLLLLEQFSRKSCLNYTNTSKISKCQTKSGYRSGFRLSFFIAFLWDIALEYGIISWHMVRFTFSRFL